MDITLQAEARDTNVNPKTLRKQGWVPGCVFGKHVEPTAIQISFNKLKACLKHHATKIELDVKGQGKFLVGIEEVQKGHLGDQLVHISFHALDLNEKATLHVPIEFVGKAVGTTDGGILKEQFHEINIKGLPNELPDKLTIDVSKLELGASIHVSDIASQYNFEFHPDDLDKVLVSCSYPKVQKVEEPTAEATDVTPVEGAEPAAEGETPAAQADEEKKAA